MLAVGLGAPCAGTRGARGRWGGWMLSKPGNPTAGPALLAAQAGEDFEATGEYWAWTRQRRGEASGDG